MYSKKYIRGYIYLFYLGKGGGEKRGERGGGGEVKPVQLFRFVFSRFKVRPSRLCLSPPPSSPLCRLWDVFFFHRMRMLEIDGVLAHKRVWVRGWVLGFGAGGG